MGCPCLVTDLVILWGHRPKCLKLREPNVTASDILASDYDFVIVSYGFVAAQHKRLLEYREYHELARSKGAGVATAAQTSKKMSERLVLSLFSDAFEDTGRPFPFSVLDEVQYVKNHSLEIHIAIEDIPYMAVICASGTILPKWTDIYGFVDSLAGHPFDTEQEFIRRFITYYSNRDRDRLPTARDRLIKLLMAVTVGLPASILKLKDARHELMPFVLDIASEDHVLYWAAKFYEALRFCKVSGLGAIQTIDQAANAMAHAVRAQQWAAHPSLAK